MYVPKSKTLRGGQGRAQGGIKGFIPPNFQNWTYQLMQNMLLI